MWRICAQLGSRRWSFDIASRYMLGKLRNREQVKLCGFDFVHQPFGQFGSYRTWLIRTRPRPMRWSLHIVPQGVGLLRTFIHGRQPRLRSQICSWICSRNIGQTCWRSRARQSGLRKKDLRRANWKRLGIASGGHSWSGKGVAKLLVLMLGASGREGRASKSNTFVTQVGGGSGHLGGC